MWLFTGMFTLSGNIGGTTCFIRLLPGMSITNRHSHVGRFVAPRGVSIKIHGDYVRKGNTSQRLPANVLTVLFVARPCGGGDDVFDRRT